PLSRLAPPAKAIGGVAGAKLYALAVLYILFLRTHVRYGDKGFVYRPAGQSMEERMAAVETNFFERLAPYDGQWYLDIAERGYRMLSKVETRSGRLPPGNYAFFPLLPALTRGARAAFGSAGLAVAVLTAGTLSALGALVLWMLARRLGQNPILPLALVLAFPTAVFQLVLYTEGPFLFLSALALLGALERRTALVAAAGALAGLTRPQGALLALPVFVELVLPSVLGRERLSGARVLGRLAAALAPFSGVVALAAVSASLTASPGAFLSVQSHWGRSLGALGFLEGLRSVLEYGGPRADLFGLAFALALLPALWRRLPFSLALYGTALVALPLSTGSLLSFGRFVSVSIPHFLALGRLLERAPAAVRGGTVGAFAAGQVLVASGLVAWYLVG
ncbi:MAG: hypothetical protein ACUVYA_16110, partial [Planctomycetota bacterium]